MIERLLMKLVKQGIRSFLGASNALRHLLPNQPRLQTLLLKQFLALNHCHLRKKPKNGHSLLTQSVLDEVS